jgi:hypothetical protein
MLFHATVLLPLRDLAASHSCSPGELQQFLENSLVHGEESLARPFPRIHMIHDVLKNSYTEGLLDGNLS